jgi:hypothetical protein
MPYILIRHENIIFGTLYLTMLFHKCNNTNYHRRINNFKMSLPKPKTDFLKKSFVYRGAASWNKLPSDMIRMLVECQSVNSFSKILKHYFN